jgi:hypothetical protein
MKTCLCFVMVGCLLLYVAKDGKFIEVIVKGTKLIEAGLSYFKKV